MNDAIKLEALLQPTLVWRQIENRSSRTHYFDRTVLSNLTNIEVFGQAGLDGALNITRKWFSPKTASYSKSIPLFLIRFRFVIWALIQREVIDGHDKSYTVMAGSSLLICFWTWTDKISPWPSGLLSGALMEKDEFEYPIRSLVSSMRCLVASSTSKFSLASQSISVYASVRQSRKVYTSYKEKTA